ncbi:hypothetical protein [Cellulosimicrobium sp. Marseille-Q4280]|uniref:hypothetical protein n=1 Tax=Cellulosimicrobium sp. Marseille-Q4280 TaxID=2937992 RepID=UPI00203B62AC|nr:hypothetical protein [Cellulosimicrobium sp. Marseille-Q4280]
MTSAADRSRVPAGVRTGGQFAAGARGEADVHLDAGEKPLPAADTLTAALARYAITDVPADHEGVSLEQRWRETFEVLDGAKPPLPDPLIWAQLGPDFVVARHKGGPDLVWFDPQVASFWDEDRQWRPVQEVPLDEAAARNLQLVAAFSTRAGGGNRDCWCSTEDAASPTHDRECTAAIGWKMGEHPRHMHDADSEDGYADWYFKLDLDAPMREAIEARQARAVWDAAANRLAAISDGTAAPWTVMPVNPDTQAAVVSARAALEEMGSNDLDERSAKALGVPVSHMSTYYGSGSRTDVQFTPQHLEDVDAVIAWSDDPSQPAPQLAAKWAGGVTAIWQAQQAVEQITKATAPARQAVAARQAIEAGTVDEDVAAVLQRALDSSLGFKNAEKHLDDARNDLVTRVGRLRQEREKLVGAAQRRRERLDLKRRASVDGSALRWPGEPGTAPQLTTEAAAGAVEF